ncbi:MAG: PEP-CTERM sorting domain-containing protein [Bacillota bacterium]
MSMPTGLVTTYVAAAVIAYGAMQAEATLLIDLRQTGTGAHEVLLTAQDVNKPIFIDVFVYISGAAGNSSPEMFTSLQGSFISPQGAIGEIAPAGYYDKFRNKQYAGMKYQGYGFVDNGATPGQSMDLDGDGDLDLGAPLGQIPVLFRSAEPVMFNEEEGWGRQMPDGSIEFLVGRITFTPTTLCWPHVMFVPRMREPGIVADQAALWVEDGQTQNGGTGTIISIPFGYVPEPSSMCILGMAGASLLLRARRNRN